MEQQTKPRILINPPPQNLRCEICCREFKNLIPYTGSIASPESIIFNGHRVRDKEGNVKLFKTYRGSIQISASWECSECIGSSTIDDVLDYFTTDYPEDDYPNVDHDKLNVFLEKLKVIAFESKDHYFVCSPDDNHEFMFSRRYWVNYFNL